MASLTDADKKHLEELDARLDNEGGWKGLKSVGSPQISGRVKSMTHGYPYVSKTLPQFGERAEHTDMGECIVQSASHERELCKAHGFTREYHHTDPIGSHEVDSESRISRGKHEKWID